MSISAQEQLEVFSSLSRAVIEIGGGQLLAEQRSVRALKRSLGRRHHINHLGHDLSPEELRTIERFFAGELSGLTPFREAQLRELAFWRWVALEGYGGKDPRFFPFHQQHFMLSTFYRTGWSLGEMADSRILELGCGPLGMIEYIPARARVAFDPLNEPYGRLFAHCRSRDVVYEHDRDALSDLDADFDLSICHNVIDHTEQPDWWFDTLFAKLRAGGRFLFQVNLSRPDVPQLEEHRRMHPSPFTEGLIRRWLDAKSDGYAHVLATEASTDGEFYFLAWGTKTRDEPVRYENEIAPAAA